MMGAKAPLVSAQARIKGVGVSSRKRTTERSVWASVRVDDGQRDVHSKPTRRPHKCPMKEASGIIRVIRNYGEYTGMLGGHGKSRSNYGFCWWLFFVCFFYQ